MPSNPNQGHRTINSGDRTVTVLLVCGCKLKARANPMNVKSTFPCPSNMGHGYQVRWKSWVDANGNEGYNASM